MATAALEKRELHLHYLSTEYVVFSLFDDTVPKEEKKEIAKAMLGFLPGWQPGELLIDEVWC